MADRSADLSTHGYSVREAVNEHEVYAALRAVTRGYGGVVRFARRAGLSREYVQRMLYGQMRVNALVAGKLGFELRWVRVGAGAVGAEVAENDKGEQQDDGRNSNGNGGRNGSGSHGNLDLA